MLLPAAAHDWLPPGHLAYFIHDTIDTLDLSAFYARDEGGGPRNQPFHPTMMAPHLCVLALPGGNFVSACSAPTDLMYLYCVFHCMGGQVIAMGIPPKNLANRESAGTISKMPPDQVLAQLPPYLDRGISMHFMSFTGGRQLRDQGLSS